MPRSPLTWKPFSWTALLWLCSGLLYASDVLHLDDGATPGNLAARFVYLAEDAVRSREQAVLDRSDTPSFALLDYRLPGSSGLVLANAIRSRLGQDFPVIILTGDMHLAISGSDIRVLSKPIRPMRLRAAIQAILHR